MARKVEDRPPEYWRAWRRKARERREEQKRLLDAYRKKFGEHRLQGERLVPVKETVQT